MNDSAWMHQALALASEAKEKDEVPVGAVLVKDGLLIGAAHNLVCQNKDPTAHAEIEAIKQACKQLNNERLPHTTLYVTLEPCAMCMGALLHARVERVVFAARDFKAGAAGSKLNLASGFGAYGQIQVDEGCFQEESEALLRSFFEKKRN